jgi:hypothetical protein
MAEVLKRFYLNLKAKIISLPVDKNFDDKKLLLEKL